MLARFWAWLVGLVFGRTRAPPPPETPDVPAPDGPAPVDEDRADDFDGHVERERESAVEGRNGQDVIDDINRRFR